MKTIVITGPADWASALVNGDRSGLSGSEIAALDNWLTIENVDVIGVEGEDQEPRFTWSYDLHSHTDIRGGSVLDYIAVVRTA